ncbi:hypothetical protein [Streptomyces sp. NBC_00470]|uniref:hypothetical protein n=1 Tax=Streptomyces sp. NBC_00470 TaxID=2975753 RepID=UPI002F90883C
MPNIELAAGIRARIVPETHMPSGPARRFYQGAWMGGVDTLYPDADLTAPVHRHTTLDVAGYAAHLSGHVITVDTHGTVGPIAYLPDNPPRTRADEVRLDEAARRALDLNRPDASWLFASSRADGQVLAALAQLADGADRIDRAAAEGRIIWPEHTDADDA